MLTCNVTFHCKSGCRSQFYQEITAIKLQEYSSQEAGNIKYEFYFSATDSDTLLLVETWIDEAFQKQHSKMSHKKRICKARIIYHYLYFLF